MNAIDTRIRIAAFAFSTALALACTVGVGAVFEHGGNDATRSTFAAHSVTPATEVAISPASIEVVATRESAPHGNLVSGWFHRHAG